MDNYIEIINEKFKKTGYKFTSQRKAILETISSNGGKHLSAEDIYELVKTNNSDIGLATVYRTVLLLVDLEILAKINFEDGFIRYEINDKDEEQHHHHHLICNECGKIIEVKEDLLEELEREIEEKYQFEIKDHKLKFFGRCKECKNNL